MSFQLVTKKSFDKEFAELRPEIQRRVADAFLALGDQPFPPGCVKLKGSAIAFVSVIIASSITPISTTRSSDCLPSAIAETFIGNPSGARPRIGHRALDGIQERFLRPFLFAQLPHVKAISRFPGFARRSHSHHQKNEVNSQQNRQ
jgi:hypothetical protein